MVTKDCIMHSYLNQIWAGSLLVISGREQSRVAWWVPSRYLGPVPPQSQSWAHFQFQQQAVEENIGQPLHPPGYWSVGSLQPNNLLVVTVKPPTSTYYGSVVGEFEIQYGRVGEFEIQKFSKQHLKCSTPVEIKSDTFKSHLGVSRNFSLSFLGCCTPRF